MSFWTRTQSYYPEMDARTRAAEIKRIIHASGPEYRDVVIIKRAGHKFTKHQMSYASWFMLLDADYGETIMLKIRCDEVSANRT